MERLSKDALEQNCAVQTERGALGSRPLIRASQKDVETVLEMLPTIGYTSMHGGQGEGVDVKRTARAQCQLAGRVVRSAAMREVSVCRDLTAFSRPITRKKMATMANSAPASPTAHDSCFGLRRETWGQVRRRLQGACFGTSTRSGFGCR